MRRDSLLLDEIVDSAEQILILVADISVADLAADRQRRDALLWNFTVLGEATNQLSEDLRARYPQVPWQQPVRLRNRIVHGYWSIDLDIAYTTAATQIAGFAAEVRRIRAEIDGE